jgi:hypothetical protein
VATNTLMGHQWHQTTLHIQDPAPLPPELVLSGPSPPDSNSPHGPRRLGLAPGLGAPNSRTMSTPISVQGLSERVEIVDCGDVTVELLLLPLFSLAPHERRSRMEHVKIGESELSPAEQLAIEAELEREAEEAAAGTIMADMSWTEDPSWKPAKTQAELKLEANREALARQERLSAPSSATPSPRHLSIL